jgi:hypothetical protein
MALRLRTRPLKRLKLLKNLIPCGKAILIRRKSQLYIDGTGWQQSTSSTPREWHGYYRTRFGSYKGRIIASTPPQYYIHNPPKGLKERHSHAACFNKISDDGWYSAHFKKLPKDLDSGVIKLERVLCEAYLLTNKTA